MSDDKNAVRETTNRSEQRRNPRFPNSSIWSDDERRQHREERDATIEDAGLVTDRMIDDEEEGED
jgi:hypothetical protein